MFIYLFKLISPEKLILLLVTTLKSSVIWLSPLVHRMETHVSILVFERCANLGQPFLIKFEFGCLILVPEAKIETNPNEIAVCVWIYLRLLLRIVLIL